MDKSSAGSPKTDFSSWNVTPPLILLFQPYQKKLGFLHNPLLRLWSSHVDWNFLKVWSNKRSWDAPLNGWQNPNPFLFLSHSVATKSSALSTQHPTTKCYPATGPKRKSPLIIYPNVQNMNQHKCFRFKSWFFSSICYGNCCDLNENGHHRLTCEYLVPSL